jgi:hypothetical protein
MEGGPSAAAQSTPRYRVSVCLPRELSSIVPRYRINLIIQRLEHLISTITNAETGQRGYLITDRLGYLEPYYTAVSNIQSQLGNLDIMIANEPDNQQLSLNELNILLMRG